MAALPQPPSILTFEEARHVVEGHAAQVRPRIKEKVELLASIGRILAEPIAADRDFPPFRRAMRDGYALRAADLTNLPVTLEVIGERPGPHQIRNSNSYSLAAQVQDAGGVPKMLGIARDEAAPLRRLIEQGLKHDLLLLTGGVSMGRYDLVEQVLAELGAEFFFTGAQIQPGRPVVFGRVQERYFFGLPGNPISTMVTFELFARPLLEASAGMAARELSFVHARLKSEIKTKTGLRRFLPGLLSGEFEQAEVELAGWHGSGDVAAMARSNCYIVIPPDRERIAAGEWVAILMR